MVKLWGKNLTNRLVQGEARALATVRVFGRTFLDPVTRGVTSGYNF